MKTININLLTIFCIALLTQACTTTLYSSACHELSETNARQIKSMVKKAKAGSFERHIILLETGNEINTVCRSHYIDGPTYSAIPASLNDLCLAQGNSEDKYCSLYMLDGVLNGQLIY